MELELPEMLIELEDQHLYLVDLFDTLYDKVGSCQTSEQHLGSIYNALLLGFLDHFSYEQSAMEAFGYPRLAEHTGRHTEFLVALNDRLVLDTCNKRSVLDLLMLINSWLTAHIKQDDGAFMQYAKSKSKQ